MSKGKQKSKPANEEAKLQTRLNMVREALRFPVATILADRKQIARWAGKPPSLIRWN